MNVWRRISAYARAARSERSVRRRSAGTAGRAGALVAVLVSVALLSAAAGCGTGDGSGSAGSSSGPPAAGESPVPVTTAEPSASPSPTADGSATAVPSDAEPDGSYEERARYWVERQEAWRKKDPICLFGRILEEKGILDGAGASAVAAEQEKIVNEAVEFAKQSPLPDPAELEGAQYCD